MTKSRANLVAAVNVLETPDSSFFASWSSWKCTGCDFVQEVDGHAQPRPCLCGKRDRRWRRTGMGTIKACNFSVS